MANVLPVEKQEAVVRCLVDGVSVRATERIVGVHRDTILRLMVRIADGCQILHDRHVRDLDLRAVQVDEIWGFVHKKQRWVTKEDDASQCGDFWTFVAIDADTKIVPSYLVGKRDGATANAFMADLSGRLSRRVQISSDGLNAYVDAVERAFGGGVDYGQIVKFYEAEPIGAGRYSPPKVVDVERVIVEGHPDEADISTSYVERQNLTMRMNMRRLTRLTNAFSKKVENLRAAVALHFAYYNFVRIHQTLRVTPAMAAGVTPRVWTIGDLVAAGSLKP